MRKYHWDKLKLNAWNLLFLILGVLFWIIASYSQKQITYYHGSISVRYTNPILTMNKIQAVLEAMSVSKEPNIPDVTLWKSTEKIELRNSSLGRTAKCDLIEVNGDMSELFPGILLEGGYLSQEDFMGCVIDSETAFQIFSTLNVIGLTLEYHDTEYFIRGVLKTPNYNFMIIHSDNSKMIIDNETHSDSDKIINNEPNKTINNDSDKALLYDCMELRFANQVEAKALAEEFVFANDLAEPSVYINGYLYQKLSKQIVNIPIWLFSFWLLWICLKVVYSYRKSYPLFLLNASVFLILAIIILKFVNFRIYIPREIIPNRWSDFDFWGILWSDIKASLAEREQIMQYYKDVLLRKEFHKAIVGSLLAAGLELCLFMRLSGSIKKKIMDKYEIIIKGIVQRKNDDDLRR